MEQVARSQREAQEKRKANISEKVKKRKDKKMGIKPKKSPKVTFCLSSRFSRSYLLCGVLELTCCRGGPVSRARRRDS
jgi:hypothetical protein